MAYLAVPSSKLSRLKSWWFFQSTTVRAYCAGGGLMLASLVCFFWHPKALFGDVAMYASCTFYAIAFLHEAYEWTVPKLQFPLVKALTTALGVMALAAATGISRLAVTEATNQEATYFLGTVAFLVPISFVPVLAALITLAGALSALGTMTWAALNMIVKGRGRTDFEVFVLLSRLFAGLTIALITSLAMDGFSTSSPWMRWIAGQTAFSLDLHRDPLCGEHPSDRVLRINDELVIVGRITVDGTQFVRRQCPLEAETAQLGEPKASQHQPSQPLTATGRDSTLP